MKSVTARLVAAASVPTLLAAGHAQGYVINFNGLAPSSTQSAYVEAGYALDSINGSIFVVGNNGGAYPTAPAVFPSNLATSFQLTARPFTLRSIDLAALNASTGPRSITFNGIKADGGAVSHTITTSGGLPFATHNFPNSFSRLSALSWTQGAVIADSVSVQQGETITFDGLVPSSVQNTHAEKGFRLNSINGDIFVAGDFGGSLPTAPGIFPSNLATAFSFQTTGGRNFDVFSIDLGAINDSIGSRSIQFTGTVAGGGTVSQTFVTDGGSVPDTFAFDSRFTNLTTLTWNQGAAVADNIVAAVTVPEPTTLALLAALPAIAARRRRG